MALEPFQTRQEQRLSAPCLKAETQSQETPHRWQQPCCCPDEVVIKFQHGCSQNDLACVATARKPASERSHLLFASFRPGFGGFASKSHQKPWLKASRSMPGPVVLRSALAADSCATPPAAKIHC